MTIVKIWGILSVLGLLSLLMNVYFFTSESNPGAADRFYVVFSLICFTFVVVMFAHAYADDKLESLKIGDET